MDFSLIISSASAICAVIACITAFKRNIRTDTKTDTSELTTVIIKLENIAAGIVEIKSDMSNFRCDMDETKERLTRCEESAKQAHKRLDEIKVTR